MKAAMEKLVLLGYTAMAYAAAAPASADAGAAAICGDLGVLSFEGGRLPDGVSPGNVRMCAGHPNGRVRVLDPQQGASLAPMEGGAEGGVPSANETALPSGLPLTERSCYYNAPYGCSGGYCWKTCGDPGDGKWCWTATNGGLGSWNQCSTYVDCSTNSITAGCGKGCLKPGVCGCSC
ncbi:hypothetical protein LX36DRAFT_615676 [Colletotrichum falcatum]|nr:hypothetical protein LX36DRAFT_615676 [Colletotrichum falcatum]